MNEDAPKAQDHRGLRLILSSTLLSVTGDGMLVTATPLMAAALTSDPAEVGFVAAASMASWIVMGLPAGALVDHWDRRSVMIFADLGRAVVLAVFGVLVVLGAASIYLLALTVFLVGVGTCFFAPASQAIIPDLVGRDMTRLTAANGKFWAFDTFGRTLAGPPVGALAFSAARAVPFLADAASFLLSGALIAALPKRAYGDVPRETPPVRRLVVDGTRYLLQHPELRVLALAGGAYNLAYNIVFSTLVLFALQRLDLGTLGFGLLIGVAALGGVAAGWAAPRLLSRMRPMAVYAISFLIQGAAWLAIVATSSTAVACVSLAAVGAASTAVTVSGGSARQMLTPPDRIGRVAATTRLVTSGAAAIGAFLGGLIAKAEGIEATFIVGSSMLAVFAGLAIWHVRRSPAHGDTTA